MRTIAILVNVILLAIIGWMMAKGEFEIEAEYMPLFASMVCAPILSIMALLLRGVGSKDWLSRYFARKALEERRKLEILQVQTRQDPAPPATNDAGRRAIKKGAPSP